MIKQYKVRRKTDGKFYAGSKYCPRWLSVGKAWNTVLEAKAIASSFKDSENVEVVEVTLTETAVFPAVYITGKQAERYTDGFGHYEEGCNV